jgi:hypothetical protein
LILGNQSAQDHCLTAASADRCLSTGDIDDRLADGGAVRADADRNPFGFGPEVRFHGVDFHDDHAVGAGPGRDPQDHTNVLERRLVLNAELRLVRAGDVRHLLTDLHVGGLVVERLHLRAAEDLHPL